MQQPTRIDLDIKGQICPSCLLLTLRELNLHAEEVRSGKAEIVVSTDDRQATATIPDAAGNMGYATEVTRLGSGYRIRVFART